MSKTNKVDSLLGLATKSGNVVSGEFATEKAVKSGKAQMVIVSSDASHNTVKMFSNMCIFYEVPFYRYGEKEQLGHAMGKSLRSSLAITNPGLAQSIQKHLEAIDQNDGGSEHGENENT